MTLLEFGKALGAAGFTVLLGIVAGFAIAPVFV
jgi:hypothetical protein